MIKKLNTKKKNKKHKTETSHLYTGFFAYPEVPLDRKEIIENAIKVVNNSNRSFKLTSWTNANKSSSRIISNILESIVNSDVLLADISGLNLNVLYEVGFAFGLGKKLMLFIQGSSLSEKQKDINDINIISGFQIESYENSEQLSQKILSNKNILNYSSEIEKYLDNNINIVQCDRNACLFLKGLTKHEIAIEAERVFKNKFSKFVIDDWKEDSSQNLKFYLDHILSLFNIVFLFVNKSWEMSRKINARFSFIAGIALALKRKIYMIGLPNFETPFDFKDIIISPENKSTLTNNIESNYKISEPTLNTFYPNIKILTKNQSSREEKSKGKASVTIVPLQNSITNDLKDKDKELILIDMDIGNSTAEMEEDKLSKYFIKTSQYYEALKKSQVIIVGSKGSGKTACFYQIRNYFKESNSKNLVCEIKPSDYKMERFLESLKLIDDTGRGLVGHLLENVWKTIAYCSIIELLYNNIINKPNYIGYTNDDNNLINFVDKHYNLIHAPFEQKLEYACNWLNEVSFNVDNYSKKIHDEFLSEAKKIIEPIIKNINWVVFLFDNLDKAWEVNNNLKIQAQLIWNLLGLDRRLKSDFNINNVSLLIFLRRNIYEFIYNISKEPDKLSTDTIELQWVDKELLLQVLDERLKILTYSWTKIRNIDPWKTFFKYDNNLSLKDQLYNSILPRPRDLIRFIQFAIDCAINHKHTEIHKEDLEYAENNYSRFALDQIIAEYKAEEPWIEETLYTFVSETSSLTFNRLYKKLKLVSNEKLDNEQIMKRINTLININFLGVKIADGPVSYAYRIQDSRKMALYIKNKESRKKVLFIIHPVFFRHLNIKTKNKINILNILKGLYNRIKLINLLLLFFS